MKEARLSSIRIPDMSMKVRCFMIKKDFSAFVATPYKDYRIPINDLYNKRLNVTFDFLDFPQEGIKYIRENKCKAKEFHNELYKLLSEYVDFFMEHGLKERYLKAYCQTRYCFYYLLIKLGKPPGVCEEHWDKETEWIQNKWLSVCIDSTSNPDIRSIFEIGELDPTMQINAEGQTRDIIFEKKKLKQEFIKTKREPYLGALLDWYLQRYNLVLSARLVWNMLKRKEPSKPFNEICKAILPFHPVSIILLAVTVLLCLIGYPYLSYLISGVLETFYLRQLDAGIFTNVLIILYPVILILFIVPLFYRRTILIFKLFFPRLIAGIIVGYLPLLLNEDPWKIVKGMGNEPLLGFATVSLAIVFSFYYVFSEIYKAVRDKWVALGRALLVYSIGFLESFAVGIILLDIITKLICPNLINETSTGIGLFGFICPEILYVYFPLALFIGFFAQMMWTEKPITYPI